MNNLKLKLLKFGSTTEYYLEDYCSSIKLSNNINQVAAELVFKIPYATSSNNLLPINVEMGDNITLTYTHNKIDTQIFYGAVTDTSLKGKSQELEITAYDYTWWLCKCNVTNNFNNISVGNALEYIYKYIGAAYEDVWKELGDNANIMIGTHLVQNKQASKVIYAIYNYVTKIKNTNYFYLHATNDGSTIDVTECDKYFSGLTITPAHTNSNDEIEGNLIDYEIANSMQNMVTFVDFYDSTGKPFTSIGTDGSLVAQTGSRNRYGIIIENVEVEASDITGQQALAKGQKILDEKGKPEVNITATCYGDLAYKVGYGVVVNLPNTNYVDICMYIIGSDWTWNKDGTFISKLELTSSKYTNKTDWTDIDNSTASSTSSLAGYSSDATSNLVNEILTELKKYIGLPYKFGGKSPSDGGMDCSGYIAYVYNQFASQLKITSSSGQLDSYTFTMMDEGEDVTSDFPNNLRVCDIIFPSAEKGNHVVAYIGNGQIIEEPRTGLTCRTVTMSEDSRFNSALKVIRVIPDSAWSNSNSNDTSSASDGQYSSNLVKFTESWEGYRSTVYYDTGGTATIGYGTTAAANPSAIAQGSCNESEAEQWLKDEMSGISTQITKACANKSITLNQCSFDCLCDLSYQWGWPTIITNDKGNIFSSLCSGDLDSAKSSIKSLGYGRRDNARCDMLGGTYTLNN